MKMITTTTQQRLPLVDPPPEGEDCAARLLRVLAGSDLLRLARDLPPRTFTPANAAEAERLATQQENNQWR
jgi:hypothetical protein